MYELNEVGIGLEVGDLLDGMIESIQESCHFLLIIFLDIGSYHGNLHFLVVFFHRLCALLEELQLLEEISSVVSRHEAGSHDFLHGFPSCDWRFASCMSSLDHLFPPNEDVVLELEGGHGDLLFFIVVVKAKDLVHLQCPREIFFGVIASRELWHGELELAVAEFFNIVAVLMLLLPWRKVLKCLLLVMSLLV